VVNTPLAASSTSAGSVAEERERLLLRYLPEVRYIARRIHDRLPSHVSFDDLVQAGILGLIDAVDRFDAKRNVELGAYAKFRIRGAILDSLRQSDWSPRSLRQLARSVEQANRDLASELGRWPTEPEVAGKLGMKLEELQSLLGELRGLDLGSLQTRYDESDGEEVIELLSDKDGESPFQLCMRAEMLGLVARAIEGLGEKERQVLSLYYVEELTMKEVGAVMNIGESRVSQIHNAALIQVRAHLNEVSRPKTTVNAENSSAKDGF
jgi:RNA polymerase sigma factor for flagellar operon FliA